MTIRRTMLDGRAALRIAGLVFVTLAGTVACGGSRPPLDEGVAVLGDHGYKLVSPRSVPPGPFSATACRGGNIAGLDAMLCAYAAPDARAQGVKAGETWIAGAVTAIMSEREFEPARVRGSARWLLLIVADRARVDLSGKEVQKITRAFSGPK